MVGKYPRKAQGTLKEMRKEREESTGKLPEEVLQIFS